MKMVNSILCIAVTWLCLVGTAVAQERVYAQPGQAFQRSGGLVGGVDVLFLRAYGGNWDVTWDGDTPSNEFEISPRVWLGYVGESGFGVRSRWFQYQHDMRAGTGEFEVDSPIGSIEVESRNYLDVYAVDIDFMQRVDLGCWELNAGAGIRAGGVKRRAPAAVDGAEVARIESRFEGVGPTAFAEFKRPIMGTHVSLIANGRGSVLFGDGVSAMNAFGVEGSRSSHNVLAVGEIQLGVEYARDLGYATQAFAQCLWEGQIWSNASQIPGTTHRDDLGLMGVAFNFGITR